MNFKRWGAGIAVLILCLGAISVDASASVGSIVRVGLSYGDSAVPGANLQNEAGVGYRMGFVDSAQNFIQLATTNQTKISMVKNRTVYWDGKNYVDTASGARVGAYCVDTGVSYPDPVSAQNAAAALQAGNGQNYFHCYSGGTYRVRMNNYATQSEAVAGAAAYGGVVVTGSAYCISVVISGTSTILFQFDTGNATGFVVAPSLGEVTNPVTWFKGYKYGGNFEYTRRDGNNLTVVNLLSMEDYIKGVVPYEMNASWPLEALKAQALCARSYAYTNLNRHNSQGFDICPTDHCQVYHGRQSANANSDAAVDQTSGQYILYNGTPIYAFYHSSNGGATEDVTNIWTTDYPYLRAVYDNYEDLATSTNGQWQYTVDNGILTNILNSKGYALGNVVGLTAQYTSAGNLYALRFQFDSGQTKEFTKESARTILNTGTYGVLTYSQRYTVSTGGLLLSVVGASGTAAAADVNRVTVISAGGKTTAVTAATSIISTGGVRSTPPQTQGNGSYVISGTGWGHNVGMSQNGAKAMANQGMTAGQIVTFYFTGVTIGYLP